MPVEKPKSAEEKKEEVKPEVKKEEADKRNAAAVILDDATHWLANWRRRRKLEREGKKPPKGEGREANEQEKKEASGALSTMGFGTATLGGFLAIVFAGVVVGVQKLSAWSKSFDAGLKLAYPGGGKGGGGKKEKA